MQRPCYRHARAKEANCQHEGLSAMLAGFGSAWNMSTPKDGAAAPLTPPRRTSESHPFGMGLISRHRSARCPPAAQPGYLAYWLDVGLGTTEDAGGKSCRVLVHQTVAMIESQHNEWAGKAFSTVLLPNATSVA